MKSISREEDRPLKNRYTKVTEMSNMGTYYTIMQLPTRNKSHRNYHSGGTF